MMTSKKNIHIKNWMVLLTIFLLLVSACTSSDTPDTPPANDEAASSTTEDEAATEDDTAAEDSATTEDDAAAEESEDDAGEAMATGEFDLDAILANAGGECHEPTGDPLIIGYAPDFSDLGGFADIPGSQAAGYMVELINCAGGLNGTPIEYIVEPADAADLELTLRAAQDLVDAGAHAVLGPPFSDVGLPLLNVLG
ncbi:MAG: ABC transporter substrate-binding protein, partial [Chloroflexi bacterium]|nr:ABC transporter substrate-binding protein [Chloroflexota bacterium]